MTPSVPAPLPSGTLAGRGAGHPGGRDPHLGRGVLAAPAASASSSGVTLSTTINGQAVSGSSASHPVKLYPNRPAVIDILVTNYRTRTITVDCVSLNGTVAGLTFYAYDTSVHLLLGSHRATHLRYALDLTGLDGQATGLIPATISIANPRHQTAGLPVDGHRRPGLAGLGLRPVRPGPAGAHRPGHHRRGGVHRHPSDAAQPLAARPADAHARHRHGPGAGLLHVRAVGLGTDPGHLVDRGARVRRGLLRARVPDPEPDGGRRGRRGRRRSVPDASPRSPGADPTRSVPTRCASPDEAPPPPPPAPATITTPAVGESAPGDESPA